MRRILVLIKFMLLLVICFSFNFVVKAKTLTEIVKNHYSENCEVIKETKYFDRPIRDLKYIIRHKVKCSPNQISYAYIESHIVRTMKQVLLIDVSKKKLHRLQTLLFNEPLEYKAKKNWLNAFIGKSHPLSHKIDGISGATLTANAVKNGVSKILEVHATLD